MSTTRSSSRRVRIEDVYEAMERASVPPDALLVKYQATRELPGWGVRLLLTEVAAFGAELVTAVAQTKAIERVESDALDATVDVRAMLRSARVEPDEGGAACVVHFPGYALTCESE